MVLFSCGFSAMVFFFIWLFVRRYFVHVLAGVMVLCSCGCWCDGTLFMWLLVRRYFVHVVVRSIRFPH